MSQSLWWKECDHSVWEPQNGAHFQPHLINANRDLQNAFNFHFLSNIVRRKWKVAGQVVVKHSCQDRRVRFLFVHETSDSLQPQLPQVNHTKCHWLVSLKRGEEEEKHLHLWLLLSKLCSCEEKSSQSCFPAGQAPTCADAWGYSSIGAGPCICVCWISEFYALPISPACQDPSEWQHNTLDEQFTDIHKAVLLI